MTKLVLASTSKFRQEILSRAGYRFEILAAEADEQSIVGLPPKELALQRSLLKGMDVAQRVPADTLVIGADQVLGLNGLSFDKAHSPEEAMERLRFFSGKTHYLHSGMCVIHVPRAAYSMVAPSPIVVYRGVTDVAMTMRVLSEAEIQAYVSTSEWKGCVGCYRIEGVGKSLFSSVEGDEDAIIGLPLLPLEAVLRNFV